MTSWLAEPTCDAGPIPLDAQEALDAELVGAKAANLAKARRAGLPVLDGVVLPAELAAAISATGNLPDDVVAIHDELSDGGRRPLVVRSSSAAEDTALSSMAGHFTSVVDVRGRGEFASAVAAVVASAAGAPIAVLVQPHVDPARAGVLFGLDPVSGRTDRLAVAAVSGGPQALVSGMVTGDRYLLDRHGRIVERDPGDGGTDLGRTERRALAQLAADAASHFGGPQDIEWARTVDGRMLLLQSRPVTAVTARADGPCYGPGPVAETFPLPLERLEQELWLPPLADAVAHVLVLTGRVSRRQLRGRALVVAPGGRPALDLDLAGEAPRLRVLSLRGMRSKARRLGAAWRVGRLAAAIEPLGRGVVAATDQALEQVPAPRDLPDEALLTVLDRTVEALRSLHGHELLAGALGADPPTVATVTGAEVGLRALATGRVQGVGDDDLRARFPEVLALSAPGLAAREPLPPVPSTATSTGTSTGEVLGVDQLGVREALRLRVRWIHELQAQVVREAGLRLAAAGVLAHPEEVAHLSLADLRVAFHGGRPVPEPVAAGPPLPARFRLAADGSVVPERPDGRGGVGVGAGGGRGAGPVHVGGDPPPGSVLVTSVLDPALAVHLPHLAGLVCETGSPLSHLAILAREHGVATVVGYAGATTSWARGQVVVVDGTAGTVEPLEAAP